MEAPELLDLRRFENEVRVLRLLEERGCDYVPRLLESDPENLTIVTTNVGSIVTHISTSRIKELFGQLERDYGVRHDDPFARNITYRAKDGRFCLIDFELATVLGLRSALATRLETYAGQGAMKPVVRVLPSRSHVELHEEIVQRHVPTHAPPRGSRRRGAAPRENTTGSMMSTFFRRCATPAWRSAPR